MIKYLDGSWEAYEQPRVFRHDNFLSNYQMSFVMLYTRRSLVISVTVYVWVCDKYMCEIRHE